MKIQTGALFLTVLGLGLLLMCIVPITSDEEVINTSFTVNPSTKYGPSDPGTSYHTRVLSKSILKGEVNVEGESIYLTVNSYNTPHLQNISVIDRYIFTINPANDLYVFIFDNTKGISESRITFTLKEIWTRPLVFGPPPNVVMGSIALFSFLSGLVALVITRLKVLGEE